MKRLLPLLALLLPACAPPSNTGALDPDRILHMAGEEAGQIPAPKERLTRQLNIAHRQTHNDQRDDARKTLASARATLESPEASAGKTALTAHERLAGWISLSELARGADDAPFANAALDQALRHLESLGPVNERCDYVLGIAREVRALRGDKEAARLIAAAGDWAVEIPAEPMRRSAYVAFAMELFRCDDYEAARTVLRKDPDPAWRSDSLTSLADRARSEVALAKGNAFFDVSASASKSASPPRQGADAPFIQQQKRVDFNSNFYRE